jgi:catechol 2,3-dioxygenase-like lactoylglutathione lyase family enzyme
MIDHVSIQCADVRASAAFYDAVLASLGGQRIMDRGDVIGYGIPPMPNFWIGPWSTGTGFRESHIAFSASDRAAVRAFFDVATAAGAEVLHEPRVWPEYHPHLLRRLRARSGRQQCRGRLSQAGVTSVPLPLG